MTCFIWRVSNTPIDTMKQSTGQGGFSPVSCLVQSREEGTLPVALRWSYFCQVSVPSQIRILHLSHSQCLYLCLPPNNQTYAHSLTLFLLPFFLSFIFSLSPMQPSTFSIFIFWFLWTYFFYLFPFLFLNIFDTPGLGPIIWNQPFCRVPKAQLQVSRFLIWYRNL